MASKYLKVVPIVVLTSDKVIEALLNIFNRIGFSCQIRCDQGRSFTSALTTQFFDKFGIKISHSSVNYLQNNPVECFHRTLNRLLRSLCLESDADWDKHLYAILVALRTVVNESTGAIRISIW